MRRLARLAVPLFTLLVATGIVLAPSALLAQTDEFITSFDGAPPSPTPYANAANWELFTQGFAPSEVGNVVAGGDPRGPELAQHDSNCAEQPTLASQFPYNALNTHTMTTEADTIFQCNNHIMTSPGLTGYGAIYMTPPALMDFSSGPSTVTWDMSTLRTSARDWPDIVISPFNEHTLLPYNNNDQHVPPDNIHLQIAGGGNLWIGNERIGGALPEPQLSGDGFTSWDMVQAAQSPPLLQDAARRDSFTLTLSATHIRICIVGNNQGTVYTYHGVTGQCSIDTDLPTALSPTVWAGQAAVQFNHRAYNPQKACIDNQVPPPTNALDQFNIDHNAFGEQNCPTDTWHWDNVHINPSTPYSVIRPTIALQHVTNPAGGTVSFAAPAPPQSHVEFATFGTNAQCQVSFNGGSTFTSCLFQAATASNSTGTHDENGEDVWMPIPEGVQSIVVRGANGPGFGYNSFGFNIISAQVGRGA